MAVTELTPNGHSLSNTELIKQLKMQKHPEGGQFQHHFTVLPRLTRPQRYVMCFAIRHTRNRSSKRILRRNRSPARTNSIAVRRYAFPLALRIASLLSCSRPCLLLTPKLNLNLPCPATSTPLSRCHLRLLLLQTNRVLPRSLSSYPRHANPCRSHPPVPPFHIQLARSGTRRGPCRPPDKQLRPLASSIFYLLTPEDPCGVFHMNKSAVRTLTSDRNGTARAADVVAHRRCTSCTTDGQSTRSSTPRTRPASRSMCAPPIYLAIYASDMTLRVAL